NAAIIAALGVSGGPQLAGINCSRGSHVPSDDAFRLQLMADFGFTIHEQGPDEEFYAYFRHYPMNPHRPSGAGMLQHDPDGPVVLSPFGPVLGKNEVHFGINQDMRTPAVQARFLLHLLNWLHDDQVAGSQRVWVTGWGSHCHDMLPGTPTRTEFPIMLDWLTTHFVGQPIGGSTAARFAGVPAARDAYLAWEAAHPGEVSFSYAASTTDWNEYPYLVPAVRYLTEAWYEEAMSAVGAVRWHRMTASASAGGPYSLYVAYTADGLAATVDLSAALGAGDIAAVNPASGSARRYPTTSVTVTTVGTILAPPNKLMAFAGTGDFEPDGDVDLADFAQFENCFTGPGGTLAPGCEPGDFDGDNDIDCDDWAQFMLAWTAPGQPPELLQCSVASIPTVSQWGLVTLTMLLLIAGTIVIRRTRRAQASPLVRTSCVTLIALVTASAPARASQNPAAGGFVLVTERAGTTVAKIDVDTDQIIGRATVGNQPSDLAADHLRRWVYVAANLDHKIVAMKADTLETADLNIPGLGKLPIGVEITPDGGTLLVTTRGSDGIMSADDRLDVIRLNASSWPPTGSLIASISTGLHPIGACLARDGRHAVITVRNQPAILIVDLQTYQIVGQAQNLPPDA
ncbi:MAG: hypothetical protein AAB363_10990, partial [Planctomycetota bacterium]